MWGSEFTSKAATLQGEFSRFRALGHTKNLVISVHAACCVGHRALPPPRFEVSSRRIIFKSGPIPQKNVVVGSFGGVANRAEAMHAIAPSTPPHVCPRQGHRRPTLMLRAAGAGGVTTGNTCVIPAAKLRRIESAKCPHACELPRTDFWN